MLIIFISLEVLIVKLDHFFLYISSPIVKSKKFNFFFSELINLYNNKFPGDKFLNLKSYTGKI